MKRSKENKAKDILEEAAALALKRLSVAEATARTMIETGVPYSNRELDSKFKAITDIIEGHFTTLLASVEGLSTKVGIQNGRVSKMEGWRGIMVGGLTVLSVVVVPAIGYLAYLVIHNSNQVSAMAATLNALKH